MIFQKNEVFLRHGSGSFYDFVRDVKEQDGKIMYLLDGNIWWYESDIVQQGYDKLENLSPTVAYTWYEVQDMIDHGEIRRGPRGNIDCKCFMSWKFEPSLGK